MNRFTLETSRPRFYAGGDVITGASNVSNAMAYGKQAARSIDLQLMEARPLGAALFPTVRVRPDACRRSRAESRRHGGHALAASARVRIRRRGGDRPEPRRGSG